MTARAFGGVARSSVSDRKVHDFRTCDLAVPVPAIFSGGGNRVRRRIHEAVGPERTNWLAYSEKLDEAAAWSGGPSVAAAAETDDTSPFWTLTKTYSSNSESKYPPAITPLTYVWTLEVSILATASSSICSVGIFQSTTIFGNNADTTFQVLRGPGVAVRGTGALINVSGLSLTVPTRLKITRRLTTLAYIVIPVMYPDGYASTTIGRSTKFTRVHLGEGIELGPYIKTLGAPVTTTDWPRRTLNGNGTTPQYGDGGWWSTDGTADLLPSNVLGPTGHPMSKLARRATGVSEGCYAYQSSLTFIAGEKYARRIVAQAGDNVGDLVFVELATSPGVYIANGTINVRTGEVPTVNNGTIVLMGRIGKQFIFEMRGTAPASVATGYCSWIIPFAGALGTGHYFGCDQTELGEVCTAHMHSGLGQYGSAVTPPFGELVDVDAGQPRIQYGEDGFGRGFVAERASGNMLAYSQPKGGAGTVNGWNANGVGAAWIDNAAYVPGGGLTATLVPASGGGTKYASTTTLTAGNPYTITLRVKPIDTDYWFLYADGPAASSARFVTFIFASKTFSSPSPSVVATAFEELEDGWWDLSMTFVATAAASDAVHVYPSATGAAYVGDVQCEPGAQRTSIMPTAGSTVTSDAESLETFDLQALDLHNGRGTILVDFNMPEVTSGNSHGIMSCANANGFEWMGVYTSTTDVAVSCYSGGTHYQFVQGGFSAGDRVRAALTFDTGYFASAVNGVPGPVTYGNNPIVFDRVIVGDLVGPRAYPADTIINSAFTTGRVSVTDELCEWTRL